MNPKDNPIYQEKLRLMNISQRQFRFKSESGVGSHNNGVVSTKGTSYAASNFMK